MSPTVTLHNVTVTSTAVTLGTAVATLTAASANTTKAMDETYTAPSDTSLDSSTTYGVFVEGGSDGVLWFGVTTGNEDATSAAGWSIGDQVAERAHDATSGFTLRSDGPGRIKVTGTAKTGTNNAPTVATVIPDQSATAGTAFSYAFPANTFSDADSDTLSYTATKADATALPTWLSFTASTRAFSGTPQAADIATVSVKVTASDGNGGSVSDTFDIVVSAAADTTPPRVQWIVRGNPSTSPTNADSLTWFLKFNEEVENVGVADFLLSGTNATMDVGATVGVTNGYTVNASGGDLASLNATVTLSIASGHDIEDVAGNALANTTPTDANDNTFVMDNMSPTVTITDVPPTSSAPFTATFTFSEAVTEFVTSDITLGNATSTAFTVTSPRVYTQTIAPEATGTVTVDVAANAAEDLAGNGNVAATRASSAYTAGVVNNPPTVANAIPDQSATAGTAFSYAFPANTFSDADSDTLSYTATKADGTALPTWLTFTDSTRTFSGTPQAADIATVSVKVTASDGNGGSVSDEFDITVSAAADTSPPTLTRAVVNRGGLFIQLEFSENLQSANLPPASAFTVMAGGSAVTVGGVVPKSGAPDTFLITVSPTTLRQGQAVVVTYTDPSTGDDANAIQDTAGNETASFTTGMNGVPAVTNNSTVLPTAPGASTGLTATASGTTTINLSWTAPTDNGGRVITGYKIEVSSDSGSTWTDRVANTSSTTTTYAHTGLAAGATRHYRVSAINTIGTGTASNVDSATTGTAANAAPTASDGTVTATEDTDYTFTAANFNFTDTDVDDALSSVKITSLPAAGTLQVDGTMIASTDLPKAVTKVDIDASKLTYSPPANANGDDYATFQFKVNDGTDDSDAAFTMTIDVTAVNDPPTGQLAILGDPVFGATLTLDFSAIMDADGLPDLSQSDIGWYHSGSTNPEARLTTSYTLTTKDVGKQLDVVVEYDDDGGEKETLELLSWPDGGTIAAIAPGAPTGLVATASGTTRIDLSWTTPASTGGSAITGYKIEVSSDGGTNWTDLVANSSSTTTTYTPHRAHRRRHPPLPGLGHQHGRHRRHLDQRRRRHHPPATREDQGSQCSGGHRHGRGAGHPQPAHPGVALGSLGDSRAGCGVAGRLYRRAGSVDLRPRSDRGHHCHPHC